MGPLGTAGPFENINDCSVLELALQPYRRPNTDRLWVSPIGHRNNRARGRSEPS